MKNKLKFILFISIIFFCACRKEQSMTTGWEYNNPKNGGFQVVPYLEQETGPGLVLIEGGTFAMGRTEQDVLYDWNNVPRRATVSSFYMDQTEIRNLDYLEYLYWINRVYVDYPEVYKKSVPDTLVWRDKLAYNEPLMELYLRHPAYREYPVVGVSWVQATDYCAWRTDRVNEYILIREGVLNVNPDQQNEDNFNTAAYLAGQYEGSVKDNLQDLNPNGAGTRPVKMEDGILLPSYRLPTEQEWEYAAVGLIGNTIYENVAERRLYPWNGHVVRNSDPKMLGEMMANFKRGRGDMMGVAGRLNDNADITAPVTSYWPNDYGLYNMAGNVSEWVMDVYRPLSVEDFNDFRGFRGNVFKTQRRGEEGEIVEKDSLGRIIMDPVDEQNDKKLSERRNYRQADNINYIDGDKFSSISYKDEGISEEKEKEGKLMYDYGLTSMINDKARVYKGGSWKDRAYWMSPGNRRFLDENQSTDYIGFRCAMIRVGSPVGF
ncbi:MAG: SUMF1/EgtB/PvdO family nonheme iron enzyme [Bacteroidota bacterium]|nr:SUMF1/EgtB/PvdO family nonheme iron enzyme [Bacteroidota bacterium]